MLGMDTIAALPLDTLSAAAAAADTFIEGLHRIEQGMKPVTAAGLDGVLET